MLAILLGDEPATGHVERLGSRPWPFFVGLSHGFHKHSQVLRIPEEVLHSSLSGLRDESCRIGNIVVPLQDLDNPGIRQRIKPQHLHLAIGSDCLQALSVVGAEPVRLSAGEPES
ncbi:MAG: hypothetical protein OXE96_00230 [Gemmatimonadetes bacterium]|nr:hypothetical protein [Gemmatimonadota bacterium]